MLDITDKNDNELFKNAMPLKASNCVFEKLAIVLLQVRLCATTLKNKMVRVFMKRIHWQEKKPSSPPKTRDWLSRDGWQASGDYKTFFKNLL